MGTIPKVLITLLVACQLDLFASSQPTTNDDDSSLVVEESRLYDDLFMVYNKEIMPSRSKQSSLNLTLGMDLIKIVEINKKKESITISGFLAMNWQDYRLKWDGSSYNGVETLIVPLERIWSPDITLYNADLPTVTKAGFHVHLQNNGAIMWVPHMLITAHCKLEPGLAEQYCTFNFGSWVLHGFKLNLKYSGRFDLNSYSENKDWELLEVKGETKVAQYACCPEPYPKVVFTLKLKERNSAVEPMRREMKYEYAVPAFFLAFLNCMIFLLPPASNEKAIFGLLVLFGYGHLMQQVVEYQMAVGIHNGLVGLLVFCMVMSAISIMFAAWVVSMEQREPRCTRMPEFLKSFIFGCLARLTCVDVSDAVNITESAQIYKNLSEHEHGSTEKGDTTDDRSLLMDVMEEVRRHSTRSHPFIRQWRMAAFVVDRFFLIFFIIFFVIALIAAIAI